MRAKNLLTFFTILALVRIVFSSGCAVYFTGIGCPHCARADPIVMGSALNGTPAIIEYEVYHDANYNARVFEEYAKKYNLELGIPTLVFENGSIVGDRDIIGNIHKVQFGKCPTLNGYKDFESMNFSSLRGRPKIWAKGMVLIRTGGASNETQVRMALNSDFNSFEHVSPRPVALSGRNVYFKDAVRIQGWLVEYNQTSSSRSKTTFIFIILIILISLLLGWKIWKH